jgi:hypothetical protein
MKKVYIKILLALVLLLSFQLRAQYVTIPDTNFVNWLNNNGYSSCINGNQLDTTCGLILNANDVSCWSAGIQDLTGIQYFKNITILHCDDNQLTFLPPLPFNLTDLWCKNNVLDSLPSMPPSLEYFICDNNKLTTIPHLPNSVKYLKCSNNLISSLPPLTGLTNSLRIFVDNNQITNLPSLPQNLEWIDVSHNLLTTLPAFQGNTVVYANSNQITSIAGWPSGGITNFFCDSNLLTTVPSFPYLTNWGLLSLKANLLTYIPPLPKYFGVLNIDYNPIACLPKMENIFWLTFDSTQITCLSNSFIADSTYPPINNLPICDPLSGCEFYYSTYGKVYLDKNSNCQYNTNDVKLGGVPIRLDSAGIFLQAMQTMVNGFYSFETDFGSYSSTIQNNYFTNVCPIGGVNNFSITNVDSVAEDMDFAVHCPSNYDLAVKSISFTEMLWPGQIIPLNIIAGEAATFYNISCFNQGGIVEVVINGSAHYNSSAPGAIIPTTIQGDTLTWNVADFSAINPFTAFNILVSVDSNAVFGNDVCVVVNISPSIDKDPTNNSLTQCFEIFNSYDPNAKTVSPTGNFDTLTTKWMHYTIYFQNTGNAPAKNIYILDTLDQDLNFTTFEVLSQSHNVITQILPGHIIKFSFPNINLPDSNSNEPLSHGFVSYKIKLVDNISYGTTIQNTAYIYFDQNPAIITNTTINQCVIAGFNNPAVTTPSIIISPNPAKETVTIGCEIKSKGTVSISLLNVLGEKLFHQEYYPSDFTFKTNLNLSSFANGIYFLELIIDDNRIIKKIIKG